MKAILPSLRERKRYVVFEVISKRESSAGEVARAIETAASHLFGEFGKSRMALKFMMDKWNSKVQKGILRVNREYLNHAKAVFCVISKIGRNQAIVRSLGASGTLKKAERKYF